MKVWDGEGAVCPAVQSCSSLHPGAWQHVQGIQNTSSLSLVLAEHQQQPLRRAGRQPVHNPSVSCHSNGLTHAAEMLTFYPWTGGGNYAAQGCHCDF